MATPSHRISAGRGWRWRGPDEVVREGDEILVWNPSEQAPCTLPLRYRMAGKYTRETGFFVRTRKAQPTPNQPDQ
jgi:hypothetical protein